MRVRFLLDILNINFIRADSPESDNLSECVRGPRASILRWVAQYGDRLVQTARTMRRDASSRCLSWRYWESGAGVVVVSTTPVPHSQGATGRQYNGAIAAGFCFVAKQRPRCGSDFGNLVSPTIVPLCCIVEVSSRVLVTTYGVLPQTITAFELRQLGTIFYAESSFYAIVYFL